MRYLHPVTMREKFLASGVYVLTDPAYLAPIQEEWSIHQLPDRSWFIRIDSQAWQPGHSRIMEVLRTSPETGGQFERCDLAIYTGPTVTRERFVCFDEYLQWSRGSEYHEIPHSREIAIVMPGWVNTTALLSHQGPILPLTPPFQAIAYEAQALGEFHEGSQVMYQYTMHPIADVASFNQDRVLWRLQRDGLMVQLIRYARNVTDGFKMI